ncbi:L,D-transpeptidase [Microbulbifer rhizosphaerae]|uniref:Lipoprotein-anchoring transpeptidase ErfK/SrfK n=1 Tax=Microbulbifer rhizosphaerae TaxID=1562603 RepID=A0A7W4Z7Z3_9GAMM|nr:L,D-transpeptidase [Microbulbifer rhizosphaerae]MBB3060011.1 lipoprotein-anchoring transpeptidase ErfK/SrfK [Microbulbifer rhizosphaerae]
MLTNRRHTNPLFFLFPSGGLALFLVALLGASPALGNSRGVNWFDDQAAASFSGSPSIKINLSEQRAYFYKGGRLVGVSKVSSGKKGYGTRPGHFRVLSKHPNHRSTVYGSFVSARTGRVVKADVNTRKHRRPPGTYYRGARMNHYIRFNGGIGMHASGNVPNYPASHGCVRMPPQMARKFYRHARVGTPVRVTW